MLIVPTALPRHAPRSSVVRRASRPVTEKLPWFRGHSFANEVVENLNPKKGSSRRPIVHSNGLSKPEAPRAQLPEATHILAQLFEYYVLDCSRWSRTLS